jgi:hypothetical protein
MNPTTAHASDNGVSIFADLVIWQIIVTFKSIFNAKCNREENPALPNVNRHGHWTKDVLVNAKLLPLNNSANNAIRKSIMEVLQNKEIRKPDKAIATLNLETPILSPPVSIDNVAILCAPAIELTSSAGAKRCVFDENLFNKSIMYESPLKWVHFDIYWLMKSCCAGWVHSQNPRMIQRFDDYHSYSTTVYTNCSSGSLAFKEGRCLQPSWSKIQGNVKVLLYHYCQILHSLIIRLSTPFVVGFTNGQDC